MRTGLPLLPCSQYRFTPFSNEFTGTGAAPVTGACSPIVIVEAVTPVVSPGPDGCGAAGRGGAAGEAAGGAAGGGPGHGPRGLRRAARAEPVGGRRAGGVDAGVL